jgi:hypothetical protein
LLHLIHIRHARCNVKGYFKKYFSPALALTEGELSSNHLTLVQAK